MNVGRGYTAGMKRLAFVPFVLLALAGCGNKGPLVHPESPVDAMAVPATTTTPADATMPAPASTAPAAPTDATAPASPVEPSALPAGDS